MVVRFLLSLTMVTVSAGAALAAGPPLAPKIPVVDTYFGTKITDPYRWMETRSDPQFVAWLKGQDAYARSVLGAIPGVQALQARIAAKGGGSVKVSGVRLAGGRMFYLKRLVGEETFKLYVRQGHGGERILIDPDKFAGAGTHGAIDYFSPSPDGAHVAVSVSTGGSENGVLHVVQTADGKVQADAIDRVPDGQPSWTPDGSGFFYNRFALVPAGAAETEKYFNSRAMFHRLGDAANADTALIGTGVTGSPEVNKVDVAGIAAFPGSRWAVAFISHGAEPALDVYVAPLAEATRPAAHWRRLATAADGVTDLAAVGDRLFVLTHKDAPRYKVVEIDAATGDLAHAKVVAAPGQRVVQGLTTTKDALYIQDLDGGLSKVRRFDLRTGTLTDQAMPAEGTVSNLTVDPTQTRIVFAMASWLMPESYYAAADSAPQALGLAPAPTDDLSPFVSEEVQARAKDGTMIPLSIVHRRDVRLDGKNPVWLTGYGAYGAAISPAYVANYLPFLEDGGVFAVAHVRGGGEFGEDWHQAGRLETKPNTYTDLIVCAEYLVGKGYGSPQTLAIQGRSAGGITVGMATTARPDLFRVVINSVGDNNTLRAEHGTDGEANAKEYGSTATKAGFEALYAVDATQHVKAGAAYPAVYLSTGYNDPRVAPFQPGKMAAHLQAATSSRRPVILRVDFDAGHGMGSTRSQRERELAEELAFFYWQIGKPAYQPTK